MSFNVNAYYGVPEEKEKKKKRIPFLGASNFLANILGLGTTPVITDEAVISESTQQPIGDVVDNEKISRQLSELMFTEQPLNLTPEMMLVPRIPSMHYPPM